MICVLEDNAGRVRRFDRAVRSLVPCVPVRFWYSAPTMMGDLVGCLEHARLISLDHDLVEPADGVEPGNRVDPADRARSADHARAADRVDPGTGYDVARFLAELIPCCPVVLHTSNGERGTRMRAVLSRAGWSCDRVYPLGDDWIDTDWLPLVRRRLGC